MSNKSDLQQHNTDLSNILSIADGLPLEEVIKALASTGKYAWKKYEMGESGMVVIDILLTNPPLSDSIGTYIRGTVTSSDINVNMLDADDFAGITIPCTVDGGAHSITLGRGGKVSSNNFNPTSWSYNNGEIRIYTPEITMDIFKITTEIQHRTYIGVTVDNSETAYPDGGMQDEYWYERIQLSDVKAATGKVTLSSGVRNLMITHGLGRIPIWCGIARTSYANNATGSLFYPNKSEYSSSVVGTGTSGSSKYTSEPVLTEETMQFTSYSAGYLWNGEYEWFALA